jgi:hypothetical protein
MNKLLIIIPNIFPELQHTLLPLKCCKLGSVLNYLLFGCFHFKLTFVSIKELGSALVSYVKRLCRGCDLGKVKDEEHLLLVYPNTQKVRESFCLALPLTHTSIFIGLM